MTRPRPGALAPWAPLLVALAVRLTLLPWAAEIPHAGDAAPYIAMARDFARSGAFTETDVGVRPPLHRVLVALGLDEDVLPFEPYPGSYLLQIGCDLITCVLLMTLAARLFGRRAGLATGWLYALFPTTALYGSLMIMAEAPSFMLLAGGCLALLGVERRLAAHGDERLRKPLLLAGALFGLGILTKEVLLPVTAAAALSVGFAVARRRGWRPGLGAGGLLLGAALLVTAPWGAYNLHKHGLWVVSSTATDLVLMHGNMPHTASGDASYNGFKRWNETERVADKVRLARATYLDALTEYPLLTLRRAWTRLRIVLGPEVITPTWIGHWLEGQPIQAEDGYLFQTRNWRLPSGSWARAAQLADAWATALVAGLAAAGLWRHGRGRLHARLAVTTVALLVLAYMATWAESRYRLTFLPLLLPFAGVALAGSSVPGAPRPDPTRAAERVGLAVALLLLTTTLVLPPPPVP